MEYVSRCPACSSLVRPGQDWCTLCHADLRPPQLRPTAQVAEPDTVDTHVEGHLDPLIAPLALLTADPKMPVPEVPVPGKHARGLDPEPAAEAATTAAPLVAPSPIDDAELAAMIAQLAAESAHPLHGAVGRLPDSQNLRILLALGVGGGIALVLIVGSWLLGLVFG